MPRLASKAYPMTHTPRIPFIKAYRACLLLCTLLAGWALGPSATLAGLGPENVFLVVNRASWASQTVANYYVELRQIPASNIYFMDWRGGTDSVSVETFRQ